MLSVRKNYKISSFVVTAGHVLRFASFYRTGFATPSEMFTDGDPVKIGI
ncbi:Uncharacterized protein dnm_079240 [Desulfonema magnum]|uniref:Uncharacterized protein n=1 Tax=Desulfonema magnum TaxID=45655 RepID=A0A975BU35_9BACT|nr:Uncharacterized protein dnm_079240 [Desulfonema magnum]